MIPLTISLAFLYAKVYNLLNSQAAKLQLPGCNF